MKKKFEYEFEDESLGKNSSISYEYDEEYDEKMRVQIEHGVPVLYANQKACLALAKIFAKLALGEYRSGFHLHLPQDFDADQPEAIRIMLDNEI